MTKQDRFERKVEKAVDRYIGDVDPHEAEKILQKYAHACRMTAQEGKPESKTDEV